MANKPFSIILFHKKTLVLDSVGHELITMEGYDPMNSIKAISFLYFNFRIPLEFRSANLALIFTCKPIVGMLHG